MQNFKLPFAQVRSAVDLKKKRDLTELETQGLIQAFEMTHELAWNVIKDYFLYQGISDVVGSRDATREGFKRDLLK